MPGQAPDPLPDLASPEALNLLFAPLTGARAILAAVSGGPDSMALMHLLARWSAAGTRTPIHVATVDHRLRPEAAGEAALVAREAAVLDLPHRTLVWEGEKPSAGLQEAARHARYRLLVEAAREAGASHLVTAHTLDDQAETVLIRLAAGSGPAGLAGMRPEREREGVSHVRPLLHCPKRALVGLCEREGWAFVNDPSNSNERFARVRWRRLMPLLAEEGLTAERLARLAERMSRVEDALDATAREALLAAGFASGEGKALMSGAALQREPFEIALRMMEQALAAVGCEAPRLHRLEACVERLREAVAQGEALRATLGGALVRLDGSGKLILAPEPARRRGR